MSAVSIPPWAAFRSRLILFYFFTLPSCLSGLGSQFGTPESEVLTPFAWRGRAESGVSGESAEERAKWVDTRGLLSKIVDVFMREPTDSLYRFWLASCVEAFLRGGRYNNNNKKGGWECSLVAFVCCGRGDFELVVPFVAFRAGGRKGGGRGREGGRAKYSRTGVLRLLFFFCACSNVSSLLSVAPRRGPDFDLT